MSDRELPNDLRAERALLGAMLLSTDTVENTISVLTAGDFYSPHHKFIYAAMVELYKSGSTIDPVTVASFLRRDQLLQTIGGMPALIDLQANCPNANGWEAYSHEIIDHSALRRMIKLCTDAIDTAYTLPPDVGDFIETFQAEMVGLETPMTTLPDGFSWLEDFMGEAETEQEPWVIKGLLCEGWRCVIVAAEGFGKTMLLHQLAVCAAKGIHPFVPMEVPPVRVLMVDCENPRRRLGSGFTLLDERVNRPLEPETAGLWRQPGAINLRNRADRVALEKVISHVRPQLVCAGPIYKMFESTGGDSHEQVAREIQAVWDKLRTRYGFALVLEAHAGHGANGVRNMRPEGSAHWLKWSEFGLKLIPDASKPQKDDRGLPIHYTVERFRGDRITEHAWPDSLSRSADGVPWQAGWSSAKQLDYIFSEDSIIAPRPQAPDVVHNEPPDEPF